MRARPPTESLPEKLRAELVRWVRVACDGDDPASSLCKATAELASHLEADRCSMLGPVGRDALRIIASSDTAVVDDLIISLDRYPELRHVLASGEPILVRDVSASELLRLVREVIRPSGTMSIAAVPIRLQGVTGILRITSAARRFSTADLRGLHYAAHLVERTLQESTATILEDRGWSDLALRLADAVLEVAPDGRVAAVHGAVAGALGDALSGAVGRSLLDVLDPPDTDRPETWLAELLQGRGPFRGHLLGAHAPDDSPVPVRVVASPDRGIPPRVRLALRCAGRDLVESDRFFTRAPVPLVAIDPGEVIQIVNRAAEVLIGTPFGELIGRRLDEFVEGPDNAAQIRASGRTVSVIRSPVDAAAEDRLAVVLLDDRSTGDPSASEQQLRKQIERQMDRVAALQKQVGELRARRNLFLSSSAHELKTPLTVLQIYVETLLDDLSDGLSDEQRSFIEVCYESVLHLRRLVIDLVDLASLEIGKIQLDFQRVEMAVELVSVVEEMQPLADRSELRLTQQIPDDLPAVRADAARVQQLIRNLLDNAFKFTAAGGSVIVRARAEDDSVVVEVVDTGVGIPADMLSSIFDEFVQVSGTASREGSGLGLAVCRRLVTALGGRIGAESEQGRGSTFSLWLPRWPE